MSGYDSGMFEGKPPSLAEAQESADPQEHEPLRPMQWNDLVARLEAVRDLRASLSGGAHPNDGSFDADSARCIAAHHNGKHAVNLDELANRKVHAGIAGPAVHGDASGVARN